MPKETVKFPSADPRVFPKKGPSVGIANADLKENKITQKNVGDVHANPVTLLYFLLHEKAIILAENLYTYICDINTTACPQLNEQRIDLYRRSIKTIKRVESDLPLFRYMGDETADRGPNDFFILLIIKRYVEIKINFEFIMSNHGFQFLQIYFKHIRNFDSNNLISERFDKQYNSANNIIHLLNSGLVKADEVKELVENYYIPNISLFGYSYDKKNKSFTLYTHAPSSIKTVIAIAKELDPSDKLNLFADPLDSPERIVNFFNKVNTIFKEKLKDDFTFLDTIFLKKGALYNMVWNRDYEAAEIKETFNGISFRNVHGHGVKLKSSDAQYKHLVSNLDNTFGKDTKSPVGDYVVEISDELTAKQATQEFELTEEKKLIDTLHSEYLEYVDKHSSQSDSELEFPNQYLEDYDTLTNVDFRVTDEFYGNMKENLQKAKIFHDAHIQKRQSKPKLESNLTPDDQPKLKPQSLSKPKQYSKLKTDTQKIHGETSLAKPKLPPPPKSQNAKPLPRKDQLLQAFKEAQRTEATQRMGGFFQTPSTKITIAEKKTPANQSTIRKNAFK